MLTDNKMNEWVEEVKSSKTEHLVNNFIDDSTNLVSNFDHKLLSLCNWSCLGSLYNQVDQICIV